jgi:hypothetical protein
LITGFDANAQGGTALRRGFAAEGFGGLCAEETEAILAVSAKASAAIEAALIKQNGGNNRWQRNEKRR